MALILAESDVQELLPMERALDCVEQSFIAQGSDAVNRSRERILLPGASLHYLAGALPESQRMGMKVYSVTREQYRFLVLLFDTATGALLALIEADHLGRLRTGAASGVATKHLARPDATYMGLIGTGSQARTQLLGVARVRNLTAVKVYGRNRERLEVFCSKMAAELRIRVEPASSPEEAARFGEILTTVTNTRQPVVYGENLQPGAHLNAVGANAADRREVDDSVIRRAALLAVDSLEQAKKESGDLLQGLPNSAKSWHDVIELHSVINGKHAGRTSEDQITFFKSHGIALWDVAVASYIYQQALAKGRGKSLDIL